MKHLTNILTQYFPELDTDTINNASNMLSKEFYNFDIEKYEDIKKAKRINYIQFIARFFAYITLDFGNKINIDKKILFFKEKYRLTDDEKYTFDDTFNYILNSNKKKIFDIEKIKGNVIKVNFNLLNKMITFSKEYNFNLYIYIYNDFIDSKIYEKSKSVSNFVFVAYKFTNDTISNNLLTKYNAKQEDIPLGIVINNDTDEISIDRIKNKYTIEYTNTNRTSNLPIYAGIGALATGVLAQNLMEKKKKKKFEEYTILDMIKFYDKKEEINSKSMFDNSTLFDDPEVTFKKDNESINNLTIEEIDKELQNKLIGKEKIIKNNTNEIMLKDYFQDLSQQEEKEKFRVNIFENKELYYKLIFNQIDLEKVKVNEINIPNQYKFIIEFAKYNLIKNDLDIIKTLNNLKKKFEKKYDLYISKMQPLFLFKLPEAHRENKLNIEQRIEEDKKIISEYYKTDVRSFFIVLKDFRNKSHKMLIEELKLLLSIDTIQLLNEILTLTNDVKIINFLKNSNYVSYPNNKLNLDLNKCSTIKIQQIVETNYDYSLEDNKKKYPPNYFENNSHVGIFDRYYRKLNEMQKKNCDSILNIPIDI